MTPIKDLPDLDWNEFAKQEIVVAGAGLVAQSDFAYQIGRVAIAGLIYTSYTAPPWFWFALAKGVTLKDLFDFRALREEIPQGSLCAVNEGWPEAVKFAKFYGFEDTGADRVVEGKTYKIFRRV